MATMENLPEVVTLEEWLAARKELLAKEKELTRARIGLNAERRRLPMVRIDKPYTFEGPNGTVGLLDHPSLRAVTLGLGSHKKNDAAKTLLDRPSVESQKPRWREV
jgi:phosphoketolase